MQISSNYSMNGVPYENRRRQNDIPQFSTERVKQENESINPYMEDTDFDEKAFDMIGPNLSLIHIFLIDGCNMLRMAGKKKMIWY